MSEARAAVPGDRRRRFLVALALAAIAVGLPLAGLAMWWGGSIAYAVSQAATPRDAVCPIPPVDDGSLRMQEIELRRRISDLESGQAARLAQCRPPAPAPAPAPPPPEPAPPPEPPPPEAPPEPPPPEPPPPPPPPQRPANARPCNTDSKSGGQGVTETIHYLGPRRGRVSLSYANKSIPDQFQVFRGTRLIAESSGFVSGDGAIAFDWNPPPGAAGTELTVRVVVSGGQGPRGTTEWAYRLACPVGAGR